MLYVEGLGNAPPSPANLEGVSYDLEQDDDGDASLDPSLRGPEDGAGGASPDADNVSGGSSENNIRGDTHNEDMDKAEKSCEAADSRRVNCN
jgi:hypothetical protein